MAGLAVAAGPRRRSGPRCAAASAAARQRSIRIAGAAGAVPRDETKQAVLDEYVPVGGRSFKVASARGFKPGDTVIVRRIGNQAWIDAVGMNTDSPGGRWQPFNIDLDRVVVDVQNNTVTVDAPLTCAIEKRWGGGEIIKYEDPGRIDHVGIENLRAISEFDPSVRTRAYGNMDREDYVAEEYYADENHFGNFVTFDNLKNGWVRNVTALHFVTSMVGTLAGSKWITVQDCVSREPISQRRGGRRFIFALRGQLALVQRCLSDKGRHSFMMGRPTGSANVFLDCKATNPYSSSEPHENWANGGVYDNIQAPLTARFWKNISIGWAGANTVFWNCEGYFLVQKPPTAQNYTFGHVGVNSVVFNIPLQDTTQGERAHRIARPARHAAQPLSDAAARAARRRRPSQRRRAGPTPLTWPRGSACPIDGCDCFAARRATAARHHGWSRSSGPGGYVTRREFLAAAAAAAALGRTTAAANPLGLPFGFQAWEIAPGHAQGLGRHAESDEGLRLFLRRPQPGGAVHRALRRRSEGLVRLARVHLHQCAVAVSGVRQPVRPDRRRLPDARTEDDRLLAAPAAALERRMEEPSPTS